MCVKVVEFQKPSFHDQHDLPSPCSPSPAPLTTPPRVHGQAGAWHRMRRTWCALGVLGWRPRALLRPWVGRDGEHGLAGPPRGSVPDSWCFPGLRSVAEPNATALMQKSKPRRSNFGGWVDLLCELGGQVDRLPMPKENLTQQTRRTAVLGISWPRSVQALQLERRCPAGKPYSRIN